MDGECVVGAWGYFDQMIAQMAAERLKGLGFDAWTDPSPNILILGPMAGFLAQNAEVRVLVPRSQAEEAHAILEEEGWFDRAGEEEDAGKDAGAPRKG